MFAGFPRENVTLVKSNGKIIKDIKALVDPKHMLIEDTSIIIEEGDQIIRILPNGAKEEYIVIERGFCPKFGSLPEHYQVEVKKKTPLHEETNNQSITYNITNNGGSKTNINSVDNSTNYSSTNGDEILFELLKSAAASIDENQKILLSIDEMQKNVGKKSFTEKYTEFIQAAANHMTLFAPFLPVLTNHLLK